MPDSNRPFALVSALLLSLAATGAARAQWTVTILHPEATSRSIAYGVHGGQQVGQANLSAFQWRAALWNGSADWVSLNPDGWAESHARAVHDGQQVGWVYSPQLGHSRASLWSGTAASWVDLHPQGAVTSRADGIHGGQQVGYAVIAGTQRAVLWNGSAESWVDLTPMHTGTTNAWAYAVHNGQQVGRILVDTNYHASLWSGTAESWVDLTPEGTVYSSEAFGVYNGKQVGYTTVPLRSASIWSGTAESWVNLHPEGTLDSEALDIHEDWQVGWARDPNTGWHHASIWNGTAESWVDLHAVLPGTWTMSIAEAVWSDESTIYVVGYASDMGSFNQRAVLWTHPRHTKCAPADLNCDGVVGVSDLLILLAGWGPCDDCAPGSCPPDLTGNCAVGVADLLILLANWG